MHHTFNDADDLPATRGELVTRNNAEVAPRLSANCVTTTDFLCDTPADPYDVSKLATTQITNCSTTGAGINLTVKDANNDSYVPSPLNLMSYYFCRPYVFTAGQYARMTLALAYNTTPNPVVADRYTLDCAETVQLAPSGVTATAVTPGIAGSNLIAWTDNSANETGYIIERSTLAASGFVAIGGVDANVTNFTDLTTSTNTTYYYRIKASNSKSTYSPVTLPITTSGFCAPLYRSDGCYVNLNINVFQIKTVANVSLYGNNNTGCSTNGYGNYTGFVATNLVAGQPYNFVMETGRDGGGLFYSEHIAIWIDANNNSTFETSERVYQSTDPNTMSGTHIISASFTVPATATVGNKRLRIRSRDKSTGVVTDPCDNYYYGEAEDYTVNITAALPVEVLYFKAEKTIENTAKLSWATASEQNTASFTLLRSQNLIDFETIAKLDAFGESSSTKNYQFVDLLPHKGLNYYQLKQTDVDGKAQTFRPVSLDFATESDIVVYPNPNNGQRFTVTSQRASLGIWRLVDVLGKGRSFSRQVVADNQINITSTQKLEVGSYILSHELDGKTQHIKVLVGDD